MGIPNEEYWRRALENFFNELPGPPLIWIQSCMQPLTVQIKEEAIFTCICGNIWGSINSIIIFEYYSDYHYVSLHIFGQNCLRCGNSADVPPYFRGDAIEFAVHLLLLEVLYWCYGRDTSLELEIARRGRVLVGRGKHDRTKCQACRQGLCQSKRATRGSRRNYVSFNYVHNPYCSIWSLNFCNNPYGKKGYKVTTHPVSKNAILPINDKNTPEAAKKRSFSKEKEVFKKIKQVMCQVKLFQWKMVSDGAVSGWKLNRLHIFHQWSNLKPMKWNMVFYCSNVIYSLFPRFAW